MFTNNVPKLFWGEVILTASYLINCLPSRVLQFQTPLQILLQTHPHTLLIQNLPIKTFGCIVFAHASTNTKLDPQATKCLFLGYSPCQKEYNCYCPKTRKLFVTRNATFFENQPYYPNPSLQGENLSEDCLWDFSTIPLPVSTESPNLSKPPAKSIMSLTIMKNIEPKLET